MKKKLSFIKILSFILTACMLISISAPSILTISAFIEESVMPLLANDDDYTGVGDLKLPDVSSSPYEVDIELVDYPIYNDKIYNHLKDNGYIGEIHSWESANEGMSPYYVTAISPLYDFRTFSGWELPSNLPYREGSKSILQPKLVFDSTTVSVDIINGPDLLSYFPGVNPDHLYLRAGATALTGNNSIEAIRQNDGSVGQRVSANVKDEAKAIYLDVPIKELDGLNSINYYIYQNGAMIEPYLMLIDNTAPSVTGVDLKKEGTQMKLTLTFNEAIKWGSNYVREDMLDEFYVIIQLKGNGTHNLKMFLSDFGGENRDQLTFTGELGEYSYVNFTADKIVKVVTPSWYTSASIGVVDVAEKMYYTPVNYLEYDHDFGSSDELGVWMSGLITDYAGNPVDFGAIASRRLGVRSTPNTFEAEEVIIYNDLTLEAEENKIVGAPTEWPEDIDKTHMFAGPDNTLTVKLTTLASLTEEECSKVQIELNIKNPDGTPVTAACTSSYSFTKDYTVYGNDGGEQLTCLMFEGIELSEGMTIDVAEGEPPQIKVVTMTDEIEGKTAYPHVKAPSRQLYADFTPPKAEAIRLFMTEPEDGGAYVLGIKATVSESVESKPYYSGTLQTFADLRLGGGVEEATEFKYLVSFTEISRDAVEATVRAEGKDAVIPVNGEISLGTYPVPSDDQNYFIYIIIDSGNKLVDDLSIVVDAEDLVGNGALTESFDMVCQIDEVAPKASFPKSAKIDFMGTNDTAKVTVPIVATDYNKIVSLLYSWNVIPGELDEEGNANDAQWQVIEITPASTVTAEVTNTYGGLDDENKVYNEVLWVKTADDLGNESEPIAYYFTVSTEKPATDAELKSDGNIPTGKPELIVTGAPHASYDEELDAFTRVTVTPEGYEYQYVTVVSTGEVVDLFAFEGRQWYRVKRAVDYYETVEAIEIIGEGFTLTESHGFYGLFTHYGDLKISFENGYGNMTPVEGGYVYETARSGSYMSDPNYFTVRYTARNPEFLDVNHVDFGQMIDMVENKDVDLEEDPEGYLGYEVLRESSDKGAKAVLFNADRKRINPMRGTQIYFTLSNLIKKDWGMMDVDLDSSYVELHRIDKDGDVVVNRVEGFSGAELELYTVPDKYDDGGDFITGQYFLRVYVVSNGGSESYYDSSSMVLDANLPENDGLWRYSYQLPYGIDGNGYDWIDYRAEDKPFASTGVSVSGTSGEFMRSRMFAAYSSGVTGFQIQLRTEIDVNTYDGITVGEIEGFRYWNKLSAPTDEQIEAKSFIMQDYDDSIFIATGFDSIYTEESIPKGAEGMLDGYGLYLIKGVNTICYQVKMANGYVSPVKQFTIIVTDKTPTLNLVIDDYVPSHYTYQGEHGITNAHSIKLAVESAYSLNGSGKVDVSVVGRYGMNIGKYAGEGEERVLDERFYEDPTPQYDQLDVIASGLGAEDYAVITENSYTADYPPENDSLCTAVFVALDEYGGMTVVAPQIGDHVRVDNWGGSTDYEYNIDYDGGYRDDPYTVGRDLLQIHVLYNEPVYYGKYVVGYQNLISYNNGEWQVMEESNPDLSYNLFNIVTNDVTWGGGAAMMGAHNGLPGSMRTSIYSGVNYSDTGAFPGDNFELINWSSAVITFSGGDLDFPVTVPLAGGVVNEAGYIDGYGDQNGFSFRVSSVPLPEGKTIEDLPELDELKGIDPDTGEEYDISGHFYRDFTIKGYNIYGDYFEKSGQVAMYYTTYGVFKFYNEMNKSQVSGNDVEYIQDPNDINKVFVPRYLESMTDHGIELELTVPMIELDGDNTLRTGCFENGEYRGIFTDYYGNLFVIKHTLTKATDTGTRIEFSTVHKTAKSVEITLGREDGNPIHIDVTDYAKMSVEGNGTARVTVRVTENIEFSYRYFDGEEDKVEIIGVDNIVKVAPRLVWSYAEDEVLSDDDGNQYRFGSVTVYLVDDNFTLTDRYTGKSPSFTFYPEGEIYYVFEAENISATLGDELIVLTEDIAARIQIELRQAADPLGLFDPITGERLEDADTPDVQILAYSNQNGYYSEKMLALQVESARHSDAMNDRYGYKIFEYSGSRGSATDLLDEMGFGTAFRFEIEISDRSRTRLFVKEGLYAEAPDYETGYSDEIEGVSLNSRLLDVKKAAKFTLFIVDKENNATSVAFNVTNIGEYPVPSVSKVALSNERVRVYVIPPEGIDASTFRVSSEDIGVTVGTENDENSTYFGLWYVEYKNNDEYIINYSYSYNGTVAEGVVDASVIEINVDRIALAAGGLEWSQNKAFESTTLDVTATLTFTHKVSELKTASEVDSEKVRFAIASNKVTVTYLDNHPQIELICIADNGTRVPVILDAVENVDRSLPVVEVVSIERAENGLSATITMRSNERAVFRQGGYVGELSDDGYYYYTRRVTENGVYTYHFADMSGLITEISVTVDLIVTDELEMLYSLNSDGADAVNDPELLEIKIGDIVYIRPSRNAMVSFNSGEEFVADADSWTPMTILDTLGGYLPYIVAVDEFGNVLTQQFSKVQIPDGTPPVVSIIKYTYSVVVGSDREEVEKALLANFNAYDDGDITLKVVFTDNLSVTGVTNVEYIATDSAGNVGRAVGRLRVASGAEPWVYVDGEQVDRDASVILGDGEDVNIRVDAGGRSFRIFIKEGVKTVAQMKIGSTAVQDYSATAEEIPLGDLESGKYYTVCVLTQDRDYFRFIIYVE